MVSTIFDEERFREFLIFIPQNKEIWTQNLHFFSFIQAFIQMKLRNMFMSNNSGFLYFFIFFWSIFNRENFRTFFLRWSHFIFFLPFHYFCDFFSIGGGIFKLFLLNPRRDKRYYQWYLTFIFLKFYWVNIDFKLTFALAHKVPKN